MNKLTRFATRSLLAIALALTGACGAPQGARCAQSSDCGSGMTCGIDGACIQGAGATDVCKGVDCGSGSQCEVKDSKPVCNSGTGMQSCDVQCGTGRVCRIVDGGKRCVDSNGNPDGGDVNPPGSRHLTVLFKGAPNGSYAWLRVCRGNPVRKGDTRDDGNVEWRTFVDNGIGWRSFGHDVLKATTIYRADITIRGDEDLRFECTDQKDGSVWTAGCTSDANNGLVEVWEGANKLDSSARPTNLNGGVNCQTKL